MAEIQTYPEEVAQPGYFLPMLTSLGGTPELKNAELSDVVNPWGLFHPEGTLSVYDEFNGTDYAGVTWGDAVTSNSGNAGTTTWGVSSARGDALSARFKDQATAVVSFHLTGHTLAVGEAVETAVSLDGPACDCFVGLALVEGTGDSAPAFIAGVYNAAGGGTNILMRDGTIAGASTGVNVYYGLTNGSGRRTLRITRVTSTTWKLEMAMDGGALYSQCASTQTWSQTPDRIGLAVSTWGSSMSNGPMLANFEYLRVY